MSLYAWNTSSFNQLGNVTPVEQEESSQQKERLDNERQTLNELWYFQAWRQARVSEYLGNLVIK